MVPPKISREQFARSGISYLPALFGVEQKYIVQIYLVWHKSTMYGLMCYRSRYNITRVGHNRIYKPYDRIYMVISLPKIPYTHRVFMVLANPTHIACTY